MNPHNASYKSTIDRLTAENSALQETLARYKAVIANPDAVHLAMLRGDMAKITHPQLTHLIGPDPALEASERGAAAMREALELAHEAMGTAMEHRYSDGMIHHKSFDSDKIGTAVLMGRSALATGAGKGFVRRDLVVAYVEADGKSPRDWEELKWSWKGLKDELERTKP